jgi:hypothetical protein
MPPRRTASSKAKVPVTPVREEPCGSGQSRESLAHDTAMQPRLLAAAASRTSSSSSARTSTPKKLFKFKAIEKTKKSGKDADMVRHKVSPAVFSVIKAMYQKGPNKNEPTGNVYLRAKPRYYNNEKFKQAVGKLCLAEPLRWNTELKLYTAKVYTIEQCNKILNEMRSYDGGIDLPEAVDETVFEGARPVDIQIIETVIQDGEEYVGVGGSTYPFKDELKDRGFKFQATINGKLVQLWLKPKDDVDLDDLAVLFTEYGFDVEQYEAIDEEDMEEEA